MDELMRMANVTVATLTTLLSRRQLLKISSAISFQSIGSHQLDDPSFPGLPVSDPFGFRKPQVQGLEEMPLAKTEKLESDWTALQRICKSTWRTSDNILTRDVVISDKRKRRATLTITLPLTESDSTPPIRAYTLECDIGLSKGSKPGKRMLNLVTKFARDNGAEAFLQKGDTGDWEILEKLSLIQDAVDGLLVTEQGSIRFRQSEVPTSSSVEKIFAECARVGIDPVWDPYGGKNGKNWGVVLHIAMSPENYRTWSTSTVYNSCLEAMETAASRALSEGVIDFIIENAQKQQDFIPSLPISLEKYVKILTESRPPDVPVVDGGTAALEYVNNRISKLRKGLRVDYSYVIKSDPECCGCVLRLVQSDNPQCTKSWYAEPVLKTKDEAKAAVCTRAVFSREFHGCVSEMELRFDVPNSNRSGGNIPQTRQMQFLHIPKEATSDHEPSPATGPSRRPRRKKGADGGQTGTTHQTTDTVGSERQQSPVNNAVTPSANLSSNGSPDIYENGNLEPSLAINTLKMYQKSEPNGQLEHRRRDRSDYGRRSSRYAPYPQHPPLQRSPLAPSSSHHVRYSPSSLPRSHTPPPSTLNERMIHLYYKERPLTEAAERRPDADDDLEEGEIDERFSKQHDAFVDSESYLKSEGENQRLYSSNPQRGSAPHYRQHGHH